MEDIRLIHNIITSILEVSCCDFKMDVVTVYVPNNIELFCLCSKHIAGIRFLLFLV
jgi:hypothetical protein